MRIPSQDFLKADLVDDSGMIKATLPIGEGDCAAAAKPHGDFRDVRGIGDKAGRRQKQIVVYIVALQRGQTA